MRALCDLRKCVDFERQLDGGSDYQADQLHIKSR